jgi:hypothetical protein
VIDQSRFAVIDVRDDRNVSDSICRDVFH